MNRHQEQSNVSKVIIISRLSIYLQPIQFKQTLHLQVFTPSRRQPWHIKQNKGQRCCRHQNYDQTTKQIFKQGNTDTEAIKGDSQKNKCKHKQTAFGM